MQNQGTYSEEEDAVVRGHGTGKTSSLFPSTDKEGKGPFLRIQVEVSALVFGTDEVPSRGTTRQRALFLGSVPTNWEGLECEGRREGVKCRFAELCDYLGLGEGALKTRQ